MDLLNGTHRSKETAENEGISIELLHASGIYDVSAFPCEILRET